MRGINKVIIVGTLGNDPDVKQFPNGGSVTNVSVATSEQWTDKQTGERKEATEWHRITFNNKLAEIAAQYLRKGSQVYIEGKMQTRKYTDNQGIERYATSILADKMQMLGSKNDNGQQNTSYQRQPQGNFQSPQDQEYANQMMANAPQPNYSNQGYTNMNSGGFANGQPSLNTPRPSDVNMGDVPF